MQTIGNLNKDHAYVVAHGQQQLLEVLGLGRCLLTKDATADLGQTIHNLGYLGAKDVLDVLNGIVSILHHIVQQGRTDTGGAQTYFGTSDLGYGNGVHDIRLTRQTTHPLVGLAGKVKRFGDEIHLLTVA